MHLPYVSPAEIVLKEFLKVGLTHPHTVVAYWGQGPFVHLNGLIELQYTGSLTELCAGGGPALSQLCPGSKGLLYTWNLRGSQRCHGDSTLLFH